MVIIVTGAIGIGKTTVCQKLIEMLRSKGYSCGGILTYKDANNDIIIEDIKSGETETLASSSTVFQGPHTPRYSFNPRGIDFGVRAIDKGVSADILVVDEIGHLELRGEGFYKVPEVIRVGGVQFCVLVIRQGLLADILPRLGTVTPLVFETTLENRSGLPEEIMAKLAEKLR